MCPPLWRLQASVAQRSHQHNAQNVGSSSGTFFTGRGHRLGIDLPGDNDLAQSGNFTQSEDLRFRLPVGWARFDVTVLAYFQWFQDRLQTITFDCVTRAEWNQTDMIFSAICSRRETGHIETRERPLLIHAYRHDAVPQTLQYIDAATEMLLRLE